jgi:hypothetical protein
MNKKSDITNAEWQEQISKEVWTYGGKEMKTAIIEFRFKVNFRSRKKLLSDATDYQKQLKHFRGEISDSFCTIIKEIPTEKKVIRKPRAKKQKNSVFNENL